jgi:hypothetical protein
VEGVERSWDTVYTVKEEEIGDERSIVLVASLPSGKAALEDFVHLQVLSKEQPRFLFGQDREPFIRLHPIVWTQSCLDAVLFGCNVTASSSCLHHLLA